MALLVAQVLEHPGLLVLGSMLAYVLVYTVYQRNFHPLAKFPGPFWASLTDLWQVHQFLTLKQPYTLTELHEKYGIFVRYGPDKLSCIDESAIPAIYQKGGRQMPKTEYYDAFGAAHPNIFGTRDEAHHSLRRRHMSHSFSLSYVKEMEQYLDMNIKILREKIACHCSRDEVFDLKRLLQYYVIDTLGELAFSQTFGVQLADDESLVPPVKEHSLLAAATGAWSSMIPTLKQWLPLVPSQSLQNLFAGRSACADLASSCVRKRLGDLHTFNGSDETVVAKQRKDILTSLILAKHPETGEHLTQADLETEAFGFIIAGTHTTSATTTLLFYHLLHYPEIMAKCTAEIDANLSDLEPDQSAYSVTVAESSLPYLRNCIKENFRITPVFTMPLARRVMALEGITIAGQHIPRSTSIAVCNHAWHHNPTAWGTDHNTFEPARWEDPKTADRAKYLMHFGLGGRQCIGKTIATTNIYKLMSTLLREFEFELPNEQERAAIKSGAFKGRMPRLVSVGVSELEEPLMVKARLRRNS